MKSIFICFAFSSMFIFLISFASCNKPTNAAHSTKEQGVEKEQDARYSRLRVKADSAKVYCKEKGFNLEYCFLVDFSIHSGKKRFFVWDFNKDSIMLSSLCCHGYGLNSTQSKPTYSNVEGSYCSSLGHYKVGVKAYSQYGINIHYKLHGLDKSNSNAFKRLVVLHSYGAVPEEEIYPALLPLGYSQGCPVIANSVMSSISTMLQKTSKPVLLWIYN